MAPIVKVIGDIAKFNSPNCPIEKAIAGRIPISIFLTSINCIPSNFSANKVADNANVRVPKAPAVIVIAGPNIPKDE